MNKLIISLTFFAVFAATSNAQTDYVSKVWCADQGDGTYKNPIIYADYSDPDVCRVGSDYYMTASSFNCLPGLPILHSKDMVNWEIINYAIERLEPKEQFDLASHGNGVWAPAIRYHEGEFYIYWGDPDNGIYMVKTADIRGRWEKPVQVLAGKGYVDTCPLWDDDGRAYIVHGYAGSRAGVKSILGLIEMTPDGKSTIGEDRLIYDGHEDNETIEGPKIYKRDGYYYILAPAGGVKPGWQLEVRSKPIDGPYEWKIVMNQGSTDINGPHQGGLLDTPDGSEHWFIHFQDLYAYGRVIHLNPVKWVDGWPVMGEGANKGYCGDPVSTYKKPNLPQQPIHTPVESDNFSSNKLGLQWQWHANPNALWYFADQTNSRLRLFSWPVVEGYKNLWDVQNLLLQKFPAPDFTATAQIRFSPSDKYTGERAGLVVMGLDYAGLMLRNTSDGIILTQNICEKAEKGKAELVNSQEVKVHKGEKLWLRTQVSYRKGQAICAFSYIYNCNDYRPLGNEIVSKEGKWIGAKIGFFVTREKFVNDGGWMDVEDFQITK